MSAALTKALELHDKNWLAVGLDKSYLRTIGGVMYVAVIERDGALAAVYRVSGKRMNVRRTDEWPAALVEGHVQTVSE